VLYIADSERKVHHIRRFTVTKDNSLEGGEVFVDLKPGVPDGIRVDKAGRLYTTAGDGVQVYSTEGKLLGKILTPQSAANCTFGGPDYKTLFITANKSVWAVNLAASGIR
jgi:gluconolactonase